MVGLDLGHRSDHASADAQEGAVTALVGLLLGALLWYALNAARDEGGWR